MNLSIKSISLEYFKGIIKQTVNFEKVTDIYIQNEGGKTTIVDAFIWLFFGKHPEGKTDLDIKTKCTSRTKSNFPDSKIGDVVNNLTHSVTGIIMLDDREIELKKTFKETWGTTAKVKERHLKTHTTTYSFDGHKCAKSKYEDELSKIIDEQTFRMLTDPLYFSGVLHWSERRDILMKMRGEVDQTQVKGYAEIKDLIGTWGPEYKKQDLKSEIKKIKDDKSKIPTQIEENQRLIIEIPEALKNINELNSEKKMIQEKINQIKSDSGQQELKNQIAKIDTEILEKTTVFNTEKQKKIDALIESGTSVRQAITSTEEQISTLEKENSGRQSIIDNNESILKTSRELYSKTALEKEALENENPVFESTCPTCKQNLPADQVETSRENYNVSKSENLEKFQMILDQINADGNALVGKTEGFKLEIVENQKKIEPKRIELKGYQESRQLKVDELTKIRKPVVDVSDLQERKFELEREGSQEKPADTDRYDNLISGIDQEIKAVNQRALNVQKNQEYTGRIVELEELEVKLSTDQMDLEKQLTQLEIFIVASVESQADSINNMFELATFQMYKKQINGGIDNDVCETMLDGVRFNAVNSAGRYQVGVDIIKQLQKFYGVSLPIIVDNRESITDLPDVGCQLINLYVSPDDKEIRVEIN